MAWSLKYTQNEAQWANLWARPMKSLALWRKNEKEKTLKLHRLCMCALSYVIDVMHITII